MRAFSFPISIRFLSQQRKQYHSTHGQQAEAKGLDKKSAIRNQFRALLAVASAHAGEGDCGKEPHRTQSARSRCRATAPGACIPWWRLCLRRALLHCRTKSVRALKTNTRSHQLLQTISPCQTEKELSTNCIKHATMGPLMISNGY